MLKKKKKDVSALMEIKHLCQWRQNVWHRHRMAAWDKQTRQAE